MGRKGSPKTLGASWNSGTAISPAATPRRRPPRERATRCCALFCEYPGVPTSWFIEDQYLLGTDVLVAPLMEGASGRDVCLPPGSWIDYQGDKVYEGARWRSMRDGQLPVVMLVRDGAAIPHAGPAQSMGEIDWHSLELKVFCVRAEAAEGLICLAEDGELHALRLERANNEFALEGDALQGRVAWRLFLSPRLEAFSFRC